MSVLSEDQIARELEDAVDLAVDDFYEFISDNNDFEIIENRSMSFEKERILLCAKQNITHKIIKVVVDDFQIDDTRGQSSKVVIRFVLEDESHFAELTYTNGDYEYNEYQGNYMPLIQDVLELSEFSKMIEDIKNTIIDVFPTLLEEARSENNSYFSIKEGEDSILLEDDCPECGEEECLCISKSFLNKAGIEHSENIALCLKCGQGIEYSHCLRCDSIMLDDGEELCEACQDFIENE